ncbi:cilia- and flagella-associated protein 61 [Marchantia polymorpha subsp. ruderalis]|uniref:Cilia- and flagella-associated protein 61 N-terminal domain-containing protein n=2 Tax=Marchantia polymorpha TaxID=3197 RepID=A0AAF6AZS5_MARPO|nr:hypothetical protein MARPO_0037s0031 [Marchantia polymorpha]PTQ40847.1 hypothetical protein MARPO_0037s0031 [Marchantia polymorpha]BBN05258.1 hypothetical protein Mp_3g11660 [Marchantia polymorpha subsp. ruderalis]BBN05259.1 hypothetical protein Mp_3g11660 [Marchantia polymorpha subsp. ruderalis]|eukprot:PTQ40846.1 hypothetical protein MARPO_0037s0031 [Marchantia polymorpha]
MNFKGYTFRFTESGDADKVQMRFKKVIPHLEHLYGPIDFGRICELSLFSLVAYSPANQLLAFAAFDDSPLLPKGFATFPEALNSLSSPNTEDSLKKTKAEKTVEAVKWATRKALDIGYRKEMIMWLSVCVAAVGNGAEEEAFVRAMLYTVLSVSFETRIILHTSSLELGAMPSLFRPVARNQEFKLSLCVCSRSDVLPYLQMRRAREEDHDDLCPVIERAQKRGLPLTDIPLSAVPSKAYSVARFIRAQTEQNNVFVAEVDFRIVGLVVLVSDIDIPSLHENYDIDLFDGLAAKRIERKLTVIETEAAAPDPFAVDPFGIPDPLASSSPDPLVPVEGLSEGESPESAQPEPEPAVEVIIKWPKNAFRVVMLCMEEEFENRSIDIIDFAFKKLKKEFCLVTLPFTSPHHPLLNFFCRIKSKPNVSNQDPELSADKRCLHILHVDGLSPDIGFRPADAEDLPQLEELLDDFADKDDLLSFITKPTVGRVNMVAAVPQQVVGYALIAKDPPVEAIASHFNVSTLMSPQYHPNENHASLILFVLNPIYRCRTRLFLQHIMKQLGKTMLYCPVFANQEVPDILEDLILLPGRQHAHMAPPCYWEKASRENTPAANLTKTGPDELNDGMSQVELDGTNLKKEEGTKESKVGFVEDIMKRRSSIQENKSRPNLVLSVDPVPSEHTNRSHRKSIIINEDSEDDAADAEPQMKDRPESSDTDSSEAPDIFQAKRPLSRKMSIGVGFEVEADKRKKVSAQVGHQYEETSGKILQAEAEVGVVREKKVVVIREEEKSSIRASSSLSEQTNKKSVTIEVAGKKSVFTTSGTVSVRSTSSIRSISKSKQARGSYFGFDCALYTMSHRFLYRYRTVVNARIVVVGSSITTAAFCHQLISSQELQFTNLIMVSTVGFKCLMSTALSQIIVDLGPAYSFPKLGLDCHINVIVATMTGIDRKGHCLELSNGDILTYDWLVLSTGLQDQTRNKLGLSSTNSETNEHIGIVKTDEIILNAHEISQGMAVHAVEGDNIPPVVIYGSTLEAFCAIQKLLEEGLQGPNMILIHPEPQNLVSAAGMHLGDPEITSMLLDTILRSGVSVHSGLKLIGVEMNDTNEWIRMLKFEDQIREEDLDGMSVVPMTLEEMNKAMALKPVEDAVQILREVPVCPIHRSQEGASRLARKESKITYVVERSRRPHRPLEQSCSLLVTCDERQVDLALFRALNKESIIFDSRVVVDGVFRTNDPSIFAAGSLCKFSRYCGKDLPKLETFCGWEVGESFAAAFAVLVTKAMFLKQVPADFEGGIVPGKLRKWPTSLLPSLNKARCFGGYVPGDKWFLSAAAPKFCIPSARPAIKTLYSRADKAFCRIDLMENGEVGKLFYLGDERIPEWKLVRFVGLPASILRDVLMKFDRGEVPNILDSLLDKWAAVILHDRFIPFMEDTMTEIQKVFTKSKLDVEKQLIFTGDTFIRIEGHLMTEASNIATAFLGRFIQAHKSELAHFDFPALPGELASSPSYNIHK